MRVAAVQMNSGPDRTRNLAATSELVMQAAGGGARLVVLPEGFAYLGPAARRRELAESLAGRAGPIRETLQHLAQKHCLYLLAGGWPVASSDPSRPYNSATLVGPDGRLLASYAKLHLFDVQLADGQVYRESETTMPGVEISSAEVEGFRLGLSICYDIRFPELYRALSDRGVDVLCIPAAFTRQTGAAHWELLCRARAVEAQCYVIAPNQTGGHGEGRFTYGHSLIVDPFGQILAQGGTEQEVLFAELTRQRLAEVRAQIPALQHRCSLFTA